MTSVAPRSARSFAVLATILPATFMQMLDVTIVNVAIPSIQRELGASYAEIQLIVAGYQLAIACVLITAARLGDILGRKRMFLIGVGGFTVTSVLCGSASSPTVLVLARVFQGLASGAMFPQVLSIIQVEFPPAERGRAFGIYGATIGLAAVSGPLAGGVIIALDPFGLDWRSVFYVNVPIGIGAMIAAARLLPESRAPRARALDLAGALLATAGLFLLIFPLTEGRERGWSSWMTAMLAGAIVVLTAFFVLQARKTARDDSPLIYTSLFRDRRFSCGVALQLVLTSGIPSFFFVMTLYLQVGFGLTPLEAGLTTFPFSLGSALASLASDRIVRKVGVAWLQLGALVLTGGILMLRVAVSALGADTSSWHLVPILLFTGAGFGSIAAPLTNVVLSGVQGRDVGAASGVLSTSQRVGGALGVAVVGAIFSELLPAGPPSGETVLRLAYGAALADILLFHALVFGLAFLLLNLVRRTG